METNQITLTMRIKNTETVSTEAQRPEFPCETGNPVFYRTYSRHAKDKGRESYADTVLRNQSGLSRLGKFTNEESSLTLEMQQRLITLPSGRAMWIGGTEWADRAENVTSWYNCLGIHVESWQDISFIQDCLMQGTGCGYVLFPENISKIKPIQRKVNLSFEGNFGDIPKDKAQQKTTLKQNGDQWVLTIGDTRQGWVSATNYLFDLFSNDFYGTNDVDLTIVLSNVRKAGAKIEGFGGVANPVDMIPFFEQVSAKLNNFGNGQPDSKLLSWLICRIGELVVAGNVRRSAELSLFRYDDPNAFAKLNLWQQDSEGKWIVDPERSALRMANFTRGFTRKPTYDECLEAAKSQFYSSEGALMFIPEAVSRTLGIKNKEDKAEFISLYCQSEGTDTKALVSWVMNWHCKEYGEAPSIDWVKHCLEGFSLNPCASL